MRRKGSFTMHANRNGLWFWLFILPALLSLVMVIFIPFAMGIRYSVTSWNGIAEPKYVGLDNYIALFSDKDFLNSLWFTARLCFVVVLGTNIIGLGLALLVTQPWKARNVLRTCYFSPNLIGGLILGFIWQFIFVQIFPDLGMKGWLADATTGFWGLCILYIWQKAGYNMCIFVAYLESIPQDVIEAARIDGANAFQRFKSVTLPLLAPAFTVCLFITLSNSFKLYDQNLALTAGGPFRSTEMLAMNIYNTAFSTRNMGYAQVKAVVFFLLVGAVTLLQTSITKKREVEV